MSNRWKCPDCHGWVSDLVLVHICTTAPSGSGNWPPNVYPKPNWAPPYVGRGQAGSPPRQSADTTHL